MILPDHHVSVSQLKNFPPYHFENHKFPAWLKQPGQTTLRISNGGFKDNYANIYLAFNNWKYIQLAKRETTNKKRKLKSEFTIETIPESQPVDTAVKVEVMSS